MGWLGYTERETLDTSIVTLEHALEAFSELQFLRQEHRFAAPGSRKEVVKASSQDILGAFRMAGGMKHP